MAKKPTKKTASKKKASAGTKKKAPAKKSAGTKKKKSKKSRIGCFTVMAILLMFVIAGILVVSAIGISMYSKYTEELPDVDQLMIPMPEEKTQMFAANNELIAEFYFENREYASSREIPDNAKLAVIAIEDERFYQHRGVDLEGWGRAIYLFLKSGGSTKHGASTITMQLARHLFLSGKYSVSGSDKDKEKYDYIDEQTGRFEKSMVRKLKEGILALSIEKKYSKDEILTHYMNQIYYGHSAYGVKTAARIFFGKTNLNTLTLEEAALLAAVPNAPSYFSPYTHMDNAKHRRDSVLNKMYELNFISEGELEAAKKKPIKVVPLKGPAHENYEAPYFVEYVKHILNDPEGQFNWSDEYIFTSGLRIYTTIDLKFNKYAEEALLHGMELVKERDANVTQGAIVSIEPQTGRILAMVGGLDFKQSKFNRAWQAKRQPGSSFKPMVYMTAIQQGYPMESTVVDEETCFEAYKEPYCPNNFDHKFLGLTNLHTALQKSVNVVAVKVGQVVGIENVIKTARKMGIKSKLDPVPSLPLGTCEVSILEMANAYATLANGGYYVEPVAIERITDKNGGVLYKKGYKPGEKVLEDNVVARIIPVMKDVVNAGTGTRAKIGRPVAGKTGTTSDFRDAWFVGFVPQLSTVVWFGNDDNSPMRNFYKGQPTGRGVTGGSIPAPTWGFFMKKAMENREVRDFKLPRKTSMKVYEFDPATGTKFFDETGISTEGREHNVMEPDTMNFLDSQPEAEEDNLEFIDTGNGAE